MDIPVHPMMKRMTGDGYSDISVTLRTYTHLGLEDAADELKRMEELVDERKELEKVDGKGKFHRKCSEQYNVERMKALCFVRAFLILCFRIP